MESSSGLSAANLARTVFPPMTSSLGTSDRAALPHGAVLLTYPRTTLPMVHLCMRIRAGSVYDPPERAGVAAMVARLLTRGTARRSAREISEAIDFVGGELAAAADEDCAVVSLKVLKKDIDLGMELLSDILLRPAFGLDEVERQRSEILSEILHDEDDPGKVADKAFTRIVYDGHPYSHPAEGLETTVPAISREDVIRFHDAYYRPNGAIIALVGDVSVGEARALCEKYLGSWSPREVRALDPVGLPSYSSAVLKLIDKDLTQSNLLLGHGGIKRSNPDYYSVYLMNYIFGGGGFSSRLLINIRDHRGLAYSVGSAFDTKYSGGAFRIGLQTKNASANEAIGECLREMKRMGADLVGEAELQEAKDYLTGSFPLRVDSNSKIADYLTYVEFHGLGLNYFEEFPRRITAVTREDVLRAAQSYLHPRNFVLVVVGKMDEARIKIDDGIPVEFR